MNRETMPIVHYILLAMTAIGLKTHVTILPPLLQNVGRDAWISVVIATILIIPWGLILIYIHQESYPNAFHQWLRETRSNFIFHAFRIVFLIILLLLAAFTMRETIQWVNSTFLPGTPIFILIIIYITLCIYLASTNLETIIIANAIVLFAVIILGFFVAFTNMQVKDYTLLRPFFEHGFGPVIKGAIYPASGVIEILLFLFIQHKFKAKVRFFHYLIVVGILMGLTLGPLVGSITEFGPDEAANQLYPAYEEWRLAKIGRFIEHLDFFSIYQWLTGAFIRVGLFLYIITILLEWDGKRKRIWGFLAPSFLLITSLVFLIEEKAFIYLKGMYVLSITFITLFIISLILAVFAFMTKMASRRKKA
ncbi:endospore germination permease [Ornithinibacillus sp. 4-3]|uniref:Endospore germination permease n=1 Tax=Ornithinibacillus sp. 4-3 TaxID=3231488 RepID=A0AB39HPR9_9BACI